MQALILETSPEEKDRLVAELWERGATGFIEHEGFSGRILLEAFFREPFPIDAFAAWNARWEPVEEVNWVRLTMESFTPIEVGERFFIVPDWRDDPTPPGRLRLEVRPGMALGTGYHPTTQMCLEAMERRLGAGQVFFDVGAGSGILAQAAALLGAGRIIACDIDEQAVDAARENLSRARVPALIFRGSADAIAAQAADFVAVNISPGATIALAREIARVLRPEGLAVLSGFEPSRIDEVASAARAAGLEPLETTARDGWAAILVRRSSS